ncbi:tRNA-dependent cyclodipeptide synthase [Corynebacterium oculi]|uniref:Cyclodipeptide synthase n=1 Tax=Corynebacterium oculi TaxID=1544416 RepID=A0A0Q0Z270_9CORY|nr:tRNA-dependent cyclodipeptide synthase [Corynebacterium oculi]KQB83278.1 Cyclo(L-leucyl-L-leucyl) synthase [Corynebacterium oculi]
MEYPNTDHLIIGMSPFNPRFSTDWLANALRWGSSRFRTVDVLHPGTAAASLLTATGTPAGRALRKARQQCNRDLRTIAEASARAGVTLGRNTPVLISDYLTDTGYTRLRERVITEYDRNPRFRNVCRDMSAKAAQSRLRAKGSSLSPNIDTAVTYIFDEIPAYTHSAQLFRYPSAALSYPKPWPVGDFLQSHPTSLRLDPHSHFFVLDFSLETHHV